MIRPVTGSKTSKRKHLQQVYKTTGIKPQELADHPELPEQLAYLWNWYGQLQNGARLTFSEIQAWCSVKRRSIQPQEVDVLMGLDRVFWESMND